MVAGGLVLFGMAALAGEFGRFDPSGVSLASIAAVSELAGYARSIHSFYGNPAETYFVIACIYFTINYTLSRIARRLELRRAKEPPVELPAELTAAEPQAPA